MGRRPSVLGFRVFASVTRFPLESMHLLRKAEVAADIADLPEHTRTVVPREAPDPLTTVTTSEDHGGEGSRRKEPGGLAGIRRVDGKSGVP